MHTISTPELQTTAMPIDVLLCLGRGNSMEYGVSDTSLQNALYAGGLSLTELAPGGMVITTGLGPERLPYPETEAQAMAGVVRRVNPDVPVLAENDSTDTFENIFNASAYIPEDVRRIGIVGTRGHDARAAEIARRWFGPERTVIAMSSDVPVSVAGRALERTLLSLSKRSLKDVAPGDEASFFAAKDSYQSAIARIKNSPLRKLHSGRK